MKESYPGSDREDAAKPVNPELGLLADVQRIESILSWIIERSANYDPIITSIRRARLMQLLDDMGFTGNSAIDDFYEMKSVVVARADSPSPTIEIPDEEWFGDRIKEVSSERATPGLLIVRPTIHDVAIYAHTEWRSVGSRDPKVTTASYIQSMARIMCDPLAYSLSIDPIREGSIQLDTDASIVNGRHRSLAARALGADRVSRSGMKEWVPVESL